MRSESIEILREIFLLNGIKKNLIKSDLNTSGLDNLPENVEEIEDNIEELLDKNLLVIKNKGANSYIFITEKGRNVLKNELGGIKLTGKVTSGLEQGKYYLSKRKYKKQFKEKLGIDPGYGTLNVKLEEESIPKYEKISVRRGILIKGFKKGKEEFGDVKAFPAEIAGIECGLIIPEKSSYTRIIELISNKKLRKELELTDGDTVQVLIKPW